MKTEEYFKVLCDKLELFVDTHQYTQNSIVTYFEYSYHCNRYRLILSLDNIIVYRNKSDEEYISCVTSGSEFIPLISPNSPVLNYIDFLDKIEYETTFWN